MSPTSATSFGGPCALTPPLPSPRPCSRSSAVAEATPFEQCQVEFGTYLVADPQVFELVEPGEGALHHPPRLAESGAVRGAAPGGLQAPGTRMPGRSTGRVRPGTTPRGSSACIRRPPTSDLSLHRLSAPLNTLPLSALRGGQGAPSPYPGCAQRPADDAPSAISRNCPRQGVGRAQPGSCVRAPGAPADCPGTGSAPACVSNPDQPPDWLAQSRAIVARATAGRSYGPGHGPTSPPLGGLRSGNGRLVQLAPGTVQYRASRRRG